MAGWRLSIRPMHLKMFLTGYCSQWSMHLRVGGVRGAFIGEAIAVSLYFKRLRAVCFMAAISGCFDLNNRHPGNPIRIPYMGDFFLLERLLHQQACISGRYP